MKKLYYFLSYCILVFINSIKLEKAINDMCKKNKNIHKI